MSDAGLFTVRLLEKEVRVACEEGERDALQRAAHYLDGKMREIRDGGKVIGGEKVAIMAALNIAHEYLQQETENRDRQRTIESRLLNLQQKIEAALGQDPRLEV